jgi:hypothetical protein
MLKWTIHHELDQDLVIWQVPITHGLFLHYCNVKKGTRLAICETFSHHGTSVKLNAEVRLEGNDVADFWVEQVFRKNKEVRPILWRWCNYGVIILIF